ncbi:MAG: replication initiator protein [Microviridae sp.]|nr:MAG: replication initiator protein [Microviridae sp.]
MASVIVACFYPVTAFKTAQGAVVFAERGDVVGTLVLPCGKCVGCRLERARQWGIRVMHEASQYEANCFVTLTYDDAHLPFRNSLDYRDFQLFVRRLRKCRDYSVRYFACGEYGGELGRPHYHAALFNEGFLNDRKPWRVTPGGHKVFRSATLDRLWGKGFAEIGSLNVSSARYIARYALKKVTGDLAPDHYRRVTEDGEVYYLAPELLHMSLKPGIGSRWFDRYAGSDVLHRDGVVVDGRVESLPRFYDKLWMRREADSFDDAKAQRIVKALSVADDNTDARLRVKEAIVKARLRFYKRDLK